MKRGECLTAPAAAGAGHIIAKLPSARFPDLPDVEYASMKLAEAADVETARDDLQYVWGGPQKGPTQLSIPNEIGARFQMKLASNDKLLIRREKMVGAQGLEPWTR